MEIGITAYPHQRHLHSLFMHGSLQEKKAKAPLTGKPGRKPGRPCKNPLPDPAAAPKKRGRPRKNPIPEQTAAPKKRGRPRKNPI